jgi:hypothetical protein
MVVLRCREWQNDNRATFLKSRRGGNMRHEIRRVSEEVVASVKVRAASSRRYASMGGPGRA